MAAGITLGGMWGMSCSKLNALFKWGSGRKRGNFSLWNQTESKILFTCRSRLWRGNVSSCCFHLYTIWKQSNFIHGHKSLQPFKRCQSWSLVFIHSTKNPHGSSIEDWVLIQTWTRCKNESSTILIPIFTDIPYCPTRTDTDICHHGISALWLICLWHHTWSCRK